SRPSLGPYDNGDGVTRFTAPTRPASASTSPLAAGEKQDVCVRSSAFRGYQCGRPKRRLTDWLTERMQDQPHLPLAKSAARQRAAKDGLQCSSRGFDRAWADAVKACGASSGPSPGNAKKPPRSFATQNRHAPGSDSFRSPQPGRGKNDAQLNVLLSR